MSEKINGIWRNVKDGVSLCVDAEFIPIVLVGSLFVIVMMLISAVIEGVIVSVC